MPQVNKDTPIGRRMDELKSLKEKKDGIVAN